MLNVKCKNETVPKLISQLKLNTQNQKMDVYMRKTGISFKQIYKLTKRFFKKIEYKEKKNSQRDRPRKYKDEYSYREVLQELKYLGFKITSLK